MWVLSNSTPFAAESTWVRDQDGAEVWIVAVRGSFVIQPGGEQALDAEQNEVSRIPRFLGEPGVSSLLYETDLLHTKTRTDVLVHGHAYSPGGKPATQVDVRLKIANIDKSLRVYGDRRWHQSALGMGLSPAEPFIRMPITYERTFGGTDMKASNPREHRWEAANPVGTGFATRMEHLIGQLAPNIEDPRWPYNDWEKGHPVGFGPIARHWFPRVSLAGTYDETWDKERKPLLPSDFNEQFYQSAPEDQQTDGFLKGGELAELYGMTPGGVLSFYLPKVALAMTTSFYDGTVNHHTPVLHTVIFCPDQRSFQMIWHSQLPCHHKVNKLKVTQIVLRSRTNVSSAELESGMWIQE